MKNRVNLYHPEFHPKLRLLTLTIVLSVWVFTVIACSLAYFYQANEQQKFQSEIAKVEQDKQHNQMLVTELQNAVDNLKVEPRLLKEVEKSQQLISLKKRVLNELAGQEQLKSKGFSSLMLDLASHNPNGLWLTQINLNGINVVIKGAASDSAIIPKWLNSLGQTDYFKGQEFSDTRLYRDDEQQLNFVISTGKEQTVGEVSNHE